MKLSTYITVFCLLLSCKADLVSQEVRYAGALHDIMSGKLQAVASLDTLQVSKNLIGLGALADLQGEIQIFEGKALVSKVTDNGIEIATGFEHKAALLVYAEVTEWTEVQLPESVLDMSSLEAFIESRAKACGIDIEKPFPFRLKGEVPGLDWHLIKWDKNDTKHSHKKHKEAGARGQLRDQRVEVIGFFSKHHQGVFTHRNSSLHMHFRAEDNSLAGHVDALELDRGGIRLLLPKS